MTPGSPTRGARIQTVRQGRPDEIVLETYESGAGLRRWEISADRDHARWLETFPAQLHGETEPAAFRSLDSPFALLARARLEGGRIAAWEQDSAGILRMDVETVERRFSLVLELHRGRPNALLLDAGGTILGLLRPRSARDSGRPLPHALEAGQPYALPQQFSPYLEPPVRQPPASRETAQQVAAEWSRRLAGHDLQQARMETQRILRHQRQRLDRRLARLAEDQQAAGAAEQYRIWGDLLKIHGARARREQPGAHDVLVPDEFTEGRPLVAIPVDAALSIADNIALQFRQYRKRVNAVAHIAHRMEEATRDLATLAAAEEASAAATDAAAVWATVPAWARASRGRSPSAPAAAVLVRKEAGKKSWAATLRLVERLSSDGLTILVGRSAADNDALTFRIAKGRDWWLHASGFPGSHVVVRHPAGGPLPPATLREAAWLAAHYSKARRHNEVEVAYVERKHVRKVPKAPAGTVTFSHGKTLWVDMRDTRVSQVLNGLPDEDVEGHG